MIDDPKHQMPTDTDTDEAGYTDEGSLGGVSSTEETEIDDMNTGLEDDTE